MDYPKSSIRGGLNKPLLNNALTEMPVAMSDGQKSSERTTSGEALDGLDSSSTELIPTAYHFINVNRNTLAINRKRKVNFAALTARRGRGGSPTNGHTILIKDGQGRTVARVVQRPDAPLPCGATVYIECEHPPEVLDG